MTKSGNTCEWFVLILTFRYAESRIYPNIGAQDQPCVWRRELMTKTSKTLAVMQGLRPLFLLRCRLAPKQASANRHRRRNSLRSSGLPHSKENLENRLAQFLVFRGCRAWPLWPSAPYSCYYGFIGGRPQGPHPANVRCDDV